MAINLANLPYSINDLEPHISRETLEYHYGKHHQTYVNNLNKLIANSEFEEKSLAEIIETSRGNNPAVFNNAAQVWNHSFYWNCLAPEAGGLPPSELLVAIDKDFGSFDKFKEEFTNKALSNFGSGWTWLVKDNNGNLKIINTSNAETVVGTDNYAILTCDVWEHAYYIDYRNSRPDYLEAFWSLVNWEAALKLYNSNDK